MKSLDIPPFSLSDFHERYQRAITHRASTKKEEIREKCLSIDHWFYDELPVEIKDRIMTRDELVKIVDWKLTRNKWRPRLLDFAKGNDPSQVEEILNSVTTQLKKHDQDKLLPWSSIKPLVEEVSKLKGIGPATSAAILSAIHPSIPFFSDESSKLLLKKPSLKYSISEYAEFYDDLISITKEWRNSDSKWMTRDVERVIWSTVVYPVEDSETMDSENDVDDLGDGKSVKRKASKLEGKVKRSKT